VEKVLSLDLNGDLLPAVEHLSSFYSTNSLSARSLSPPSPPFLFFIILYQFHIYMSVGVWMTTKGKGNDSQQPLES